MTNKELIEWHRNVGFSAGRLTEFDRLREVVDRFETALYLLERIINDLPTNRDWLDPDIESISKKLIKCS